MVLLETAGAVRALPGAAGPQASAAGLLLEGFAARAAAGYTAAVPPLRRAIAMLGADDLSARERLRLPRLGCFAAADLWDDQAQHALATRWVRLARDYGALIALPLALNYQSIFAEVPAGRFDASTACFTERLEISAATGDPGVIGTAGVAEAYELAWRGRQTDARRVAAAGAREATVAGRGSQAIFGQYCLGVLELGLGNYQAALQSALSVFQDDAPFLGTQVLPDLVEAAARCGQPESADAALSRLAERAAPASTPLALGLLARSRALLAADSDAEPLYAEAIEHLKACRSGPRRAAGHRGTRPPADRRDPSRAHAAGGADRPARHPGRQQPGHRRAAVPEPLHRRLPPAQGVQEDRRDLPHPARPRDGRWPPLNHGTRTTGDEPRSLGRQGRQSFTGGVRSVDGVDGNAGLVRRREHLGGLRFACSAHRRDVG